MLLKTGDRVCVDGGLGIVEVLTGKEDKVWLEKTSIESHSENNYEND